MHSRNELGKRKHLSWVLSYVPHYNQHPNHQRHCYKLKRPEWAAFITSANAQGKGTRTWTAAIAAYIQPTFKAGGSSCSQRKNVLHGPDTPTRFENFSLAAVTDELCTFAPDLFSLLNRLAKSQCNEASEEVCWAAQGSNVPLHPPQCSITASEGAATTHQLHACGTDYK